MAVREKLENRANQVREVLDDLPQRNCAIANEVRDHLERVASLLAAGLAEDAGDVDCHAPMGADAFLVTRILYSLERCENLLEQLTDHKREHSNETDVYKQFVVPTVLQGVLFSFFRFVLRLRGRMTGEEGSCDWPRLVDVLYIRLPFWAAEVRYRLRAIRRGGQL